MAPRKETVQERKSLVAVLLADTFHKSFEPISIEQAPVLLPLVNVPLIEYSLEWLAANEVHEVLVFCCQHPDQIRSYLDESKWSADSEFMKVQQIVGKDCSSIGDALRFVDQLHVVKSDFLVLNGDHVCNIHLRNAMEAHQSRREKDSSAIMTVIMNSGHDQKQRLRLGECISHAIVDADSKRLLKYEESRIGRRPQSVECETSLFSERDNLQMRTDVVDSRMYICAPEVLMLFSENFDYQNLSGDFIGGVLSEEELGNKIYFHECNREYTQRVRDLRSYDAVSRDVLGRWTYPFLPDTRIFNRALDGASYQFQRGNQYLAMDLILPLSVQLNGSICIGPNSTIDRDCVIEESVIGKGCVIGNNTRVHGSYLHDGVKIGKNVRIHESLLCAGCIVQDGAVIEKGNLLSFGVIISRQHAVPPYNRISLCKPTSADSSDETESVETPRTGDFGSGLESTKAVRDKSVSLQEDRPSYYDDDLVGIFGAGAKWVLSHSDCAKLLSISKPLPEYLEEVVSSKDEDSDDQSVGSVGGVDADQSFEREVAETFLRCVSQRFSEENVVLELNGLKLAEVRTFVECANYIFTTLLQMCMPPPSHIRSIYHPLFSTQRHDLSNASDRKKFLATLRSLVEEWSPVLRRFLKDEDDQVELMFAFEEFFKGEGVFSQSSHWGSELGPLISNICQVLYDEDVVGEDAFLAWAAEKEKATDAEDLLFYDRAKLFIEWLRKAEEETDSD